MINKQVSRVIKRHKLKTSLDSLRNTTISLKGKKFLLLYEDNLSKAIPLAKKTLRKCTRLLRPKANITFVIVNARRDFVRDKMKGVAGFTENDNLVVLEIHTGGKWREGLVSTVAHEFSHTVRFKKFHYPNMRENLASEGLAQNFEALISGKLQPWSEALPQSKIKLISNRIKPYLNDRSYKTYHRIFLSNCDKEFPHWSGYTVSYLLVKKQIGELKTDWNKLMWLDARELINL